MKKKEAQLKKIYKKEGLSINYFYLGDLLQSKKRNKSDITSDKC